MLALRTTHKGLYSFALVLFFGLIAAIALTSQPGISQTIEKEQAMMLSDHPLAGSLWRTDGRRMESLDALANRLTATDYLLLGEKHDNPSHHIRQAELIGLALQSGRSGSVIFEMLEPSHQAALDGVNRLVAAKAAPAKLEAALEALGKETDWETRGWPQFNTYKPIFQKATSAGLGLYAGNPNRADLMSVGRGADPSAALMQDLWWDRTYNSAQRESLIDELVDAHCGMIGRQAAAPMTVMQRLKDAHMARAMRGARKKGDLAILIAGSGHIRKDRAVPHFLAMDAKILTIAMVEVVRNALDPEAYGAFSPDMFDFVIFTPRVDEIDPCDRFRAQLENMQGKGERKHGD